MTRKPSPPAAAVLLALVATLAPAASATAASWSDAGDLSLARINSKPAVLNDGRVIVTGGNTNVGNTYNTTLAELYAPATNGWTSTGSTATGRTDHTATTLDDGRVLVVGGENANICTNDQTSELYDPGAGTWSNTGNALVARTGATATRLNNGEVLLTGGGNRCGGVFSSAELYDPGSGTWSAAASMGTKRQWHSAALLSDGRVLVVGGQTDGSFPAIASAEIYDPVADSWSPTGSMATARCCGGNDFIVRLADGRVLATAGYSGNANFVTPNGPGAEIWDPGSGTWTATGSPSVGRAGGSLSRLYDGRVLAAGGTDGSTTHATAELWDPGTDTWSSAPSMDGARAHQAVAVAANRKSVLVATGYDAPNYLTSAELYSAYDVDAFFPPVDSRPTLNMVKAGQSVPVKFSIGSDQGLGIFASGYPKSEPIGCDSTDDVDGIESTATAGSSGLSYDAATDTYNYIWKTLKGWAPGCRQLVLKLDDGSTHRANFKFVK